MSWTKGRTETPIWSLRTVNVSRLFICNNVHGSMRIVASHDILLLSRFYGFAGSAGLVLQPSGAC